MTPLLLDHGKRLARRRLDKTPSHIHKIIDLPQ